MSKISQFVVGVSSFFGIMFVIILTVLTFVSVIMRYVFNFAVFFTDEISTYLIMGMGFMGMAYTMKRGDHIQVDVILNLLRGKWLRGFNASDFAFLIIYSVIQLFASIMLAWSCFTVGTRATSVLETPLFIPSLIMVIGSLMFLVEVIIEAIQQIYQRKE
jgi:TRAP-type C4-dicarboxylate transport system permease small subunit